MNQNDKNFATHLTNYNNLKFKLFILNVIHIQLKHRPDEKTKRFMIPVDFNQDTINAILNDMINNGIISIKYIRESFDIEWLDNDRMLNYIYSFTI